MVDLRATNAKLRQRAVALTMRASGANEEASRTMLEGCGYRVKVALVALKRGTDAATADALLARHDGNVRRALAD